MKKRILSLLMAVVMAFTCLPITALAEGLSTGDPSSSGNAKPADFGVTNALGLRIGLQTYISPVGIKYNSENPGKWSSDVQKNLFKTMKQHFIGGNNKFYYYIRSNGSDFSNKLDLEKVYVAQGKNTTSFISVNSNDINRIQCDVDPDTGKNAVKYINDMYLDMNSKTTFEKSLDADGFKMAAAKEFLNKYPNMVYSFRNYINYAADKITKVGDAATNADGYALLNKLFTPTDQVTKDNADKVGCLNYISMSLLQKVTGSKFDLDKFMQNMTDGVTITKIPVVCVELCTVFCNTKASKLYVVNAYQQHANMMHTSRGAYTTYDKPVTISRDLKDVAGLTYTEILLDNIHTDTGTKTCCTEDTTQNGWKNGSWGFFRAWYGSWNSKSCTYRTYSSKVEGEHVEVYKPLQPAGWDSVSSYPYVGFSYYWTVAPSPQDKGAEFAVNIEPIWAFSSHTGDWTHYAKDTAGKVGMDACYAVTLLGDAAAIKAEEKYASSEMFEVVTKLYTTSLYEEGSNSTTGLNSKVVPSDAIHASFSAYKGGNPYIAADTEPSTTRVATSKVQMNRDELIQFFKGESAQYFNSTRYTNTKVGWKSTLLGDCYATVKITPVKSTSKRWWTEDPVQSPTKTLKVTTPLKDGGFKFEADEAFDLPPIDEGTYWDWRKHTTEPEYISQSHVTIIDPGSFLDDSMEDDTTPVSVTINPAKDGVITIDAYSPEKTDIRVGNIAAIPNDDNQVITDMSEALAKAIKSNKSVTVKFNTEDQIKAFKDLIINKLPFSVKASFVQGLQPPETVWNFTINLESIEIKRKSDTYTIYPDGSADHVTKSYTGPLEPASLAASMYYNVTATPDAYELTLTDHSVVGCPVHSKYTAKELACKDEMANPHAVAPDTTVTIDLWGDDSAVSSYKKIAENATQGTITITVTQKLPTANKESELRQTLAQGKEFEAATLLTGKTVSYSYANKYGTYYTGFYTKTFTDNKVGTAMLNLLNQKQLILHDEPLNAYLKMNNALSAIYTVTIEMMGKYKKSNGTLDDFEISWMPSPRKSDDVSWFAPAEFYYNSELEQNYAEIKNGAILNEEFEAMAGTPSTRNLYFASGGNQFLVNATYSLATTNAQRTYKYTAKPIICKYDYALGVDTNFPKACPHAHGTSHTCFTAGGDPCCIKAHISDWTLKPSVVKTKPCTHPNPCTCSEENKASCPGHGFQHTADCACEKGGYTASAWDDCTSSGWTKSKPAVTYGSCGGNGHSSVDIAAVSSSCAGDSSWSVAAGKCSPYNNYEDAKDLAAASGTHCHHCGGGENYQHTRHVETYSETWWTLAKDITFMQIDDLKVWKLHASRLTDTEELFGVSEIRGYNTTEDPVIYVRKLKNVGTGNGKLYQKDKYDVNYASAAGRILYNWFPDQGDTVNLVTTSTTKGTYAGSTSTIKKQLYTPDTCSNFHNKYGHSDQSPAEVMNTFLRNNYFTNVNNDTTLTGHRFGLSVISDYILITANDSVLQSVYYHEYTAYAGDRTKPDENTGTSLYDVAKFGDTVTNPANKVANNSDTDRTSGPDTVALHSKGTASLGITSSHWKSPSNSRSNDDILKEVGDRKPDLAKAKFFWEENSYCTKGGNISNEGMYYGGYNGRCTQPSSKYDASDLRTRYKQNMTFNNLRSTIVYKYWNSKYSMQHDMTETYEQLSYNNKGPLAKPAPVTPHYKLQAADLVPIRTSENGEYSFGDSEVFYLYLSECEINKTDGPAYRHPVSKVRWAGADGFTMKTIYTDRKAGSTNTWKGINNVIIFDPIATDGYVGRGPNSSKLIDQRDPAGHYGTEMTYNLEGDGLLIFSLVGDFYQTNRYGIDYMSDKLGKGYYDGMDTTEWCQYKYVTCNDYIIIDTDGDGKFTDEKVHSPGELIRVEMKDDTNKPLNEYIFYLPEMAFEGNNVEVSFNAEAINEWDLQYIYNTTPDNQYIDLDVNNRNYCRPHDCQNIDLMDIVGVIGNLTMTDTGDFRYSNFFKKMLDGSWLVPNVVYQVDESKQARLLIDKYDIFGRDGLSNAEGWNTYGTQTHKGSLGKDNYKAFPLMPKYNNITAFQKTPVRIGYDVFLDVETVGNYYSDNSEVTVKYSYYAVDQTTGKLTPLDVYMTNDLKYVKINDFNNDETNIYNYPTYLKWTDECLRRQYTALEKAATENVKAKIQNAKITPEGTREATTYTTAGGTQTYQGDRNTLHLDSRSRNFIGDYYYSGAGNGFNNMGYTNVGTLQDRALYQINSQKWYFSCGLPSSAVFVEAGKPCTSANMKVIDDNNNFLLVTAYIVAKGDVWTLIHDGSSAWGSLTGAYPKVTRPTPPNTPKYNKDPNDPKDPNIPSSTPPTPIVVITVPPETSRDDADTMGTH